MHTEGEGFKEYPDRHAYKPITWCIPLGAGIKYDAAGLFNFRFEILCRFTGTDYFDDAGSRYTGPSLFSKYLSPAQTILATQLADRSAAITGGNNAVNAIRGNPKNKDGWFSVMLTISMALGRVECK